ncbi:MAG: transporter substrate-binding protein [Oligoflexia bacterium]|nr:transporter substrate-binding protein [Oligoflexia bacterium]
MFESEVEVAVFKNEFASNLVSAKENTEGIIFAIREINKMGGVNGSRIKPVIINNLRTDNLISDKIEEVVSNEKYKAIFGCWSAVCRRSMPDLSNRLLVYSGANEGFDEFNNTFATSPAANQLVLTALDWMVKKFGNKVYIVSAKDIYSAIVRDLIIEYAKKNNIIVLNEHKLDYPITPDEKKIGPLIEDITNDIPNVIVNLLFGDENIVFFKAFHAHAKDVYNLNIISFNIDENFIDDMGNRTLPGTYVASNFIGGENSPFVQRVKDGLDTYKYPLKNVGYAFYNGYTSVYFWKEAVEKAKSFDPKEILKILPKIKLETPEGPQFFKEGDRVLSTKIHIGIIEKDGMIKNLWSSENTVSPDLFPSLLKKEEWISKINKHKKEWKGEWLHNEGRN